MADSSGMADLRGIDVSRLVKGYAPNVIQLEKYVGAMKTSNTQFTWFSKTSGFIAPATTNGITNNLGTNVAFGAIGPIAESSWTKNTGYVKKYMLETPLISDEDIKSADVAILATNTTDLVDSIAQMKNVRIWDVLSNGRSTSGINTNAAAAAWDTGSFTGVTMVEDIMEAKENLRPYGYNADKNGVLLIDSLRYRKLVEWLVETKGANVVNWASTIAQGGKVIEFCGLEVLVDTNVTDNYGLVFIKGLSATWHTFTPITAVVITEPLIGKKVRVMTEGEATLDHPRSVNLITGM
jgi:hypothetical protein